MFCIFLNKYTTLFFVCTEKHKYLFVFIIIIVLDVVNVIMKDLIELMDPKYIEVQGKFLPRGGISIDPYCNYGRPGTKWEDVAWNRMVQHDMYPEKIDNR